MTPNLIVIGKEVKLIEDDKKINAIEEDKKNKNILLTISVEEGFRAEFKSWNVRHRLKMSKAVIKGFQLLEERYGLQF